MKLLAIPIAIVGVVLAILLSPTIQARWEANNAYKAQIEGLDLQRRQQQLQDDLQQQQATATSRALVGNVGWLGAGALLLIVVGYIGTQARRRSDPLVRFHGQLVPRRLVEDGRLIQILAERLMMDGQAQIAAAQRPNVPVNYSPHLIQKAPDLLPEMIDAPAAIEVIKPMAEWLAWIDQQPHALLAGKTKAGKTTLATTILAARLRNKEMAFVIDPHSSGWMGLPTAGSVANDGELRRALGAILGEYLQRQKQRDEYKRQTGLELPHDHWPRLNILIDECNEIYDSHGSEWRTVAKQLCSGSRKVGMSLICLAQSPLVEDLGMSGGMRENFARIALDDRTVATMIDAERDKDRKQALRAALVGLERPAAAVIGNQTWLLDRREMELASAPAGARSQVWAGWDFANGRRAAVATIEQAETLKQKVSAYETAETEFQEFQVSPEIADIVRRLRNEGKSKVQTIYLIWGAKPGGSKGFKDASQVYDAIVGESVERAA